ncbi:concanavalin A-like lectin/glucanase domain-containing protein [Glomus cerebriforme]|uniref:Concanavalin A-like lectin/glucanase domain-containing protein n=1 Tax=Glomus cerebriforme TaxID=658196 RepID=A0A397SEE8_9GLOM|nr:concanavalin A-like lectin/glucanase domain-containing protein [Glomus cerebriforme]
MTRGYSLEKDLRLLLNNPKYSDIEILCEDERKLHGQILVDIIEPLEVIPTGILLNVYRYNTKSFNLHSNNIRGIPMQDYKFNETDYAWDHVRAKMILENKGIFEWDVVIEKYCSYTWVGICAENFNYEKFAGNQPTGWVLGSGGDCYNSAIRIFDYCPSFTNGAKITVHLDMNKRSCAFTVNGKKYPEVSEWKNLPSKLYPVVSLYYPGRFRIQPHQKI